MPRASGSSPTVRFREPQNFTFLDDLNLWYCNVCTSPHLRRQSAVSAKAAMKHERGGPHAKQVQASKEHLQVESWKPQPGIQAWLQVPDYDDLFERKADEQMQRVDSLKELIPFWQRQVEAADRGEVLRLEAFLEALEAEKANDPWSADWNTATPAWAADVDQNALKSPWGDGSTGWAVEAAEDGSSGDTAHGRRSEGMSSDDEVPFEDRSGVEELDAYRFVEEFARMGSISGVRKQSLHDFYKCPTHVKVTRIQELIVSLREMGVN